MYMRDPLVVALHGAVGAQGAAVARHLLSAGHRVRAVVRRADGVYRVPSGSVPVVADMLYIESLARAYAGADAVVVQLPLVFDERAVLQARRVAEALRHSKVRHVVFNTGGPVPAAPGGVPYLDARRVLVKELEGAPFTTTILEPVGELMEQLLAPWLAALLDVGVIVSPLPAERRVPWLALDDLAEGVARAVTGAGPGRFAIGGPEALTGEEAADALAAAHERPVRWETIHPFEYGEMMRRHTGDRIALGMAGMYDALVRGPLPVPDPARLRVGETDLESWARARVRPGVRALAAA